MPDKNYGGLTPVLPIVTYTSGSTYAINGGSLLAAGATTAPASITFTGLAVTDNNVGFSPRDAYVIPTGLKLASSVITANTITVTWTNTTEKDITPPAAQTWTAVVFKPLLRA